MYFSRFSTHFHPKPMWCRNYTTCITDIAFPAKIWVWINSKLWTLNGWAMGISSKELIKFGTRIVFKTRLIASWLESCCSRLPHVPFMCKCETEYRIRFWGRTYWGPCFVFQTSISTAGGCQTQRHEKEGLSGALEWLHPVKMETILASLPSKMTLDDRY